LVGSKALTNRLTAHHGIRDLVCVPLMGIALLAHARRDSQSQTLLDDVCRLMCRSPKIGRTGKSDAVVMCIGTCSEVRCRRLRFSPHVRPNPGEVKPIERALKALKMWQGLSRSLKASLRLPPDVPFVAIQHTTIRLDRHLMTHRLQTAWHHR